MRSTIMALTAAAALSVVGVGAEAMPTGVATSAATTSPQITRINEGCGIGFIRGPLGGCRRAPGVIVTRPGVIVRRPVVVVRRPGCGVRVGPIGVRTGC